MNGTVVMEGGLITAVGAGLAAPDGAQVIDARGLSAPSAAPGGIGGQASVISLDGWTVEEMLLEPSVGLVMSWPVLAVQRCTPFRCFGPSRPFGEAKADYDQAVDVLRAWLTDARRYARASEGTAPPSRDQRLEALARGASGELPFLVLADGAPEIRDATRGSGSAIGRGDRKPTDAVPPLAARESRQRSGAPPPALPTS